MPSSPTRFVAYTPSPSPSTRKRQRLDALSTAASSHVTPTRHPVLPHSPYRYSAKGGVEDNPPPPSSESPVLPPAINSVCVPSIAAISSDNAAGTNVAGLERSLADLEAQSHAIRQAFAAEEQADKTTGAIYARQVKNYQLWWDTAQQTALTNDPCYTIIPAFPVTAAKVTVYLEYEMTRPQKRKREDGSESTGTIGVSGVKQVVSALEHCRLSNQHKYPDDPDAQKGLRLDFRIRGMESGAAHKEPVRVKMAHTLKAKGTNADTFTSNDLMKCAAWCLTDCKGPSNIYIGLRDRAMLLTSTSVAFRGDNTRNLLLSDVFLTDVIMNAKGLGETVQALTLISDNAKHNQTGRTDEHGAFRHRHVELCPVGAIAQLLFAHFHVRNLAVPNFAPDFSDTEYGDYGKREWYGLYLFPSKNDPMSVMSYDNHRRRVNLIYEKNGVNISKVTHAGREFSVKTAREYGATVDGAKALGGWSDSGSFKPCYDRALPVDALLGAAMFDAARPESHFLPREFLEPPADLVAQIFPWVESEITALEIREHENQFAKDIALHQLFKMLVWFRTILLQDCALLYIKHPQAPLFSYAPFNSPTFRSFASSSATAIADVEARVRLALKNLPQNLVQGFQGAVSSLNMEHRAARNETQTFIRSLDAKFRTLTQQVKDFGGSTKQRKTREEREPVSIPPACLSAPPAALATRAISIQLGLNSDITDEFVQPFPYSSIPDFFEMDLNLDSANIFTASTLDVQRNPPSASTAIPAFVTPFPSESSASSDVTANFTVPQRAEWNRLAIIHSEARMLRHFWTHGPWEWVEKTQRFLPKYKFQPVTKITDIWTEWETGIGGCISIRELNNEWNARWKRDQRSIKSEYSRRIKVVDLIGQLRAKPNWNLELALRFIREVYETSPEFRTTRAFCDYLQKGKKEGLEAVMQRSNTFIS